MRRRIKERERRDSTDTAFVIAAIFAFASIALIEDGYYFATGVSFWSTLRFHPLSILVGMLSFLVLLYLLQRMNDRARALDYLKPYAPLLGFSALNIVLKLNTAWALPFAVVSVTGSVMQVRRLRDRRSILHRSSAPK